MARLMLSAGMFSALAAATAVRRRGLLSASPPPLLAAMVISLMRRVNVLPRLASSAPFLCLIVAHLEWPDMWITSKNQRFRRPTGDAAHASRSARKQSRLYHDRAPLKRHIVRPSALILLKCMNSPSAKIEVVLFDLGGVLVE